MATIWINIALSILVYTFFILVLRWRFSYRNVNNKDQDGDGGLPIDLSWVPDLDLPPGVSLPGGGPKEVSKKEEELA